MNHYIESLEQILLSVERGESEAAEAQRMLQGIIELHYKKTELARLALQELSERG